MRIIKISKFIRMQLKLKIYVNHVEFRLCESFFYCWIDNLVGKLEFGMIKFIINYLKLNW